MLTASIRVLLLGLVLVSSSAGVGTQGVHKDERLGFQVRPPRGWQPLPMRVDEAWIVGKYLSPKEDHVVEPQTGWTYDHTPEMRILAFLEVTEPEPEEEQGEDEEKVRSRGKVYRDYKEYMRDNYSQGYFIEEEEPDELGGLPVTRLLIKAEGKRYVLEKKVVTWLYATDIGTIAVQIEVAADSYKKMRATINDVMRSFKTIERTKELAAPLDPLSTTLEDLSELDPAERKQRKIEAQQGLWERLTADLPKDWTAKEIDGVYVINHVDDRYARKVVEQILAVRAWLGDTFPEVGPSEYACPPIVHICKDSDEESAFREGSGTWGVSGNRLVTHKGDRDTSWEWEYISEQTMACWFREHDRELWMAMPTWLRQGLDEVIGAARAKGSKLDFDMGWLEQYRRNYLPHSGEDGPAIQALMSMTRSEYYSASDHLEARTQLAALTRFFIESRSRKTRQVLSDYLGNLKVVLAELEAEEPEVPGGEGAPGSEEEEEKLFEKREEWFKNRERRILDTTFQKTFAGWNEAQWRNLQREFRRSL